VQAIDAANAGGDRLIDVDALERRQSAAINAARLAHVQRAFAVDGLAIAVDDSAQKLARAADARGMPILGVCRGLQMLNVARGGTLVQDIPDAISTDIQHRQELPGRIPTHAIVIEPGSRLEGVMGRERHEVNSFHHQAVGRLGRHLLAVAWAPDGVVEGIEAPDRDFVVGVQWHAESLAEREDQTGLLTAFAAAAARYAGMTGREQAA